MSDIQQKWVRIGLIIGGVSLLLFIIILGSVLGCVTWVDANYIYDKKNDLGMSLIVMIPLLCAIVCFFMSREFKCFTKEDAMRQVEKQYRNGVIGQKQYQDNLKGIEMFEMEKRQSKAMIEMEKFKLEKQIEKDKEEIIKKMSKLEKKEV